MTPRLLSAAVNVSALPKDDHKYETIAGRAFVKGAGDASDIDPNDVAQGGLGDCYFLSAAAAVARANPELIRRLIKQVGPHAYEVTLYGEDHFWSSSTPHKFVVSDQFATDGHGHAVYAQPGDVGREGPELWVMLLEKAFATMKGSSKALEGGLGSTGLGLLLQGGGKDYQTGDYTPDQLMKLINDAMHAHLPVTTGTGVVISNGASLLDELKAKHPSLPDWFISKEKERQLAAMAKVGAVQPHEYSIASIDLKTRHVKIQNPWGFAHLDLSFEDYKAAFTEFSIGAAQ
ncbi:MAG: C2 family cysteine protease [Polyangia bacterium]